MQKSIKREVELLPLLIIPETKTKITEGTQLAAADLHITRYARETESENSKRREFYYRSLPGGGGI